jgi:predicted HTH domain antitoxin
MRAVTIPYPDDLPEALGQSPESFERQIQFLVAAKFYELGQISSGRAADLAGMNRVEFLEELGHYRISVFNYSLSELEQEIQEARGRGDTTN